MEIKEIKQIVDLMKKSDLSEFAVEEENFKLKIKRDTGKEAQPQIVSYAPAPPAGTPVQPAAAPSEPAPSPAAEPDSGKYITSPMVGTFYAAASPENPPYVKTGDTVTNDTIVCIIEAMKIMNEIQAEQSGAIAEILVENGQPIEYGQRLFRLS